MTVAKFKCATYLKNVFFLGAFQGAFTVASALQSSLEKNILSEKIW
jgi:hypothetical protein